MKKIFLIIFCFLAFFGFSESFRVVHLKGDIFSNLKKRNISLGDLISDKETLSVEKNTINCILYTGSKKLSFNPNLTKKVGLITDLFTIIPHRQLIGSRGGNDSLYLKLNDYFVNSSYLFLGDEEKLLLDQKYIKQLGNNKFIIVDSEKRKSLIAFENYTLKFNLETIFFENEIEKDLTIYRVNTQSGEFIKEISLHVVKADQKKLKNEIIAILTMIDKNKNNESKKDEIYNLLIDIYGGLSSHSFQYFMKTNFNF